MGILRTLQSMLGALSAATSVPLAMAQGYPSQPVKIIVQSPPGGGPDTVVRLLAEQLGRIWKQQVQVLSRPGAGGIIALPPSPTADGLSISEQCRAEQTDL